ncbi:MULTISPECIES: hypothetical protein [Nocardia]|uniref:Uncharacterized protein n=1 Tax=Nocardia fluminea TaxID=134984 RepID=A0A2N3V577_9NOCA|nr:hypothetical protein [Nocardia fluminea]PKV76716.1 hypothetical protein ATK86_7117 [Nocardia fluminea]
MVATNPPIPQQEPADGDPPPHRIDWFNVSAVTCASTIAVAVAIGADNVVAGVSAGAFVLNLAKMLRR